MFRQGRNNVGQFSVSPSQQGRALRRRPDRAGMTLTELLVVIAIMVILLGLAVPLMRTGLADRKLREAARQLNTQTAVAVARAAETGRLAGLWLESQPLPETGDTVVGQVFLAEMPPPYGGDLVGATACVDADPTNPSNPQYAYFGPYSAGLMALVSVGDFIRFDFKGPYYSITSIVKNPPPSASIPTPATTLSEWVQPQPAPVAPAPTPPAPWPQPQWPSPLLPSPLPYRITFTGSPLPANDGYFQYQVVRRPRKSSSMPLELPSGVVIDLENSGYGLTGREFATIAPKPSSLATSPIVVMFDHDGAVVDVWNRPPQQRDYPTDSIHFLLANIENVGIASSDAPAAWNVFQSLTDRSGLWVSIGGRMGRMTTAENAWSTEANLADSLRRAREYAQAGQAMGGR